jgi:hypothetical protein
LVKHRPKALILYTVVSSVLLSYRYNFRFWFEFSVRFPPYLNIPFWSKIDFCDTFSFGVCLAIPLDFRQLAKIRIYSIFELIGVFRYILDFRDLFLVIFAFRLVYSVSFGVCLAYSALIFDFLYFKNFKKHTFLKLHS